MIFPKWLHAPLALAWRSGMHQHAGVLRREAPHRSHSAATIKDGPARALWAESARMRAFCRRVVRLA